MMKLTFIRESMVTFFHQDLKLQLSAWEEQSIWKVDNFVPVIRILIHPKFTKTSSKFYKSPNSKTEISKGQALCISSSLNQHHFASRNLIDWIILDFVLFFGILTKQKLQKFVFNFDTSRFSNSYFSIAVGLTASITVSINNLLPSWNNGNR